MKVWIDGDLCTGVALCDQSRAAVFTMVDDGIAQAVDAAGTMAADKTAVDFAEALLEDVLEATEACPEECIHIEA